MLKRAWFVAILLLAVIAGAASADVLFTGPGLESRVCPVPAGALRALAVFRALFCSGALLIAAGALLRAIRDWAREGGRLAREPVAGRFRFGGGRPEAPAHIRLKEGGPAGIVERAYTRGDNRFEPEPSLAPHDPAQAGFIPQYQPNTGRIPMMTTTPRELFDWPRWPAPCDLSALDDCLAHALRLGASAVHVASDRTVKATWNGLLYDASDRALSDEEARALLDAVADARVREGWQLAGEGEGFYAVDVRGVRQRFAVAVEWIVRGDGGGVYLVFRPVAGAPPEWSSLMLPDALANALLAARDGLVLAAAPVAEPAPDLLAACVQRWLDEPERRWSIVEIAESAALVPDYRDGAGTHLHVLPMVERGLRAEAIRRCLRATPRALVVRETPDEATFRLMLEAAGRGCGVFGAVAARDAADALRRVLELFPEGYQRAVLGDLAETVRLVVARRSIPGRDGRPVPVWEWREVDEGLRAILRDLSPERVAHAAGAWVAVGHSFRASADERLRQGHITAAAHGDFLKARGL